MKTNDKRYVYFSKEAAEDCLAWSGYAKEEIEKQLINFTPMFYDRVDNILISVEEYNKREIESGDSTIESMKEND